MANGQAEELVRHLFRGAARADAGPSDGQLLEHFLRGGDPSAFEALVRRHGPLVLGVCRRVLRDPADAEDAFQATFLVLLRKAASLRRRELLANWLYGVAYRTALEARASAARRRTKERQVAQMPGRVASDEDVWQELRPLLDRELSQLPDKYRVPVVLCDLEGKTRKEAAALLGWPEGTVSGRLSRARALLARRMRRHRPGLSAGAVAAALAEAASAVPAPLVAGTVRAAAVAAGRAAGAVSARVAALTGGVLKTMLLTRLKIALAFLAVAALLGPGVGVLARHAAARPAAADGKEAAKEPPRAPVAPAPAPRYETRARVFPTSPGYSWAIEPEPRQGRLHPNWSVGWSALAPRGPGGIVVFEEKGEGGALKLTLAYKPDGGKAGLVRYRPVAFDARGGRHPLRQSFGGGAGGADGVAMYRWSLDPEVLPAVQVELLGIETLDRDGPRVIARKAAARAAKDGVEVPSFPQVGEPYAFTLTTADGTKISSRDLRSKVVLVDCWATWCAPCVALLPEIKALHEKWHRDGLEVVGFNFDKDTKKAKAKCTELGLTWPQVIVPADDKTRTLWQEVAGIGVLPRVLLIDREGILRADDPADLKAEVARLMKAPPE